MKTHHLDFVAAGVRRLILFPRNEVRALNRRMPVSLK
jgi:hypothetical protein